MLAPGVETWLQINEESLFFCQRYQSKLTKSSCLARQQITVPCKEMPPGHFKPHKFTPFCQTGNCAQGNQNLVELCGGKK